MSELINPDELPKPSGFSHAVKAGNTVHLAGQIGDGDTLAEQFDSAAANLLTALAAAGGKPTDLVSLQIFTTDPAAYKQQLKPIGEAYRRRFGAHYPAMGLFGVTALFEPGAMVELMGTAVIGSE